MYKILFLLLLFCTKVFPQKEVNITFNNHKHYINFDNGIMTGQLNTIEANVKLKAGDFSIQLVDFNRNKRFNDFKRLIGVNEDIFSKKDINNYSDGIYITSYKNTSIINLDGLNALSLETLFLVNGNLVKLSNIKYKNNKYTAKLSMIDTLIDYRNIYKRGYITFVDRINNICLRKLKNDKIVSLKKISKNKKLYYHIIDTSLLSEISYINSLKFKNIKIIIIIANSEQSEIKKIKKEIKQFKNIYYIDGKNHLQKMFKLGTTGFLPNGCLFDKHGNIIQYHIALENLKKYDN